MCRNIMVQHCPRPHIPIAPASVELCLKLTQNEPNDPKGSEKTNQHYDNVRGDVLRPPFDTTPAAVKIK